MSKNKGYSFSHIENYIGLTKLLTGVTPESISVTKDVYVWYKQEVARHAESLGLEKRDDNLIFMGVKIVEKLKLD